MFKKSLSLLMLASLIASSNMQAGTLSALQKIKNLLRNAALGGTVYKIADAALSKTSLSTNAIATLSAMAGYTGIQFLKQMDDKEVADKANQPFNYYDAGKACAISAAKPAIVLAGNRWGFHILNGFFKHAAHVDKMVTNEPGLVVNDQKAILFYTVCSELLGLIESK